MLGRQDLIHTRSYSCTWRRSVHAGTAMTAWPATLLLRWLAL